VKARRALAVAALLLVTPGIAACSRGFNEQTDQVYNPAAGVNDRSGSVDVLNALVVSGTDGSGTVIASLSNNDENHADSLTGVAGTGSDASAQVTPGGETTIPPGGLLNLATDGHIEIRSSRVVPGNYVHLKFTFAHGQEVTMQVPVVSADDPTYKGIKVPS
jgi:hypothetical protein